MKIMVDENIPLRTVAELRDMGHDVKDVRGTPEEGVPDHILWSSAQQYGRMLITTDKGFAQRRDEPHHGMFIIRLKQPNRDKIHRRVMATVRQVPEDEWPGLLLVVRDTVQSRWRSQGPTE